MPRAADAAVLDGWTFRRVPNRIALGLSVASAVSVGLFALHVGGWGLTGRLDWRLIGSAYLAGMPVAMLVTFFVGAPVLRAMHRAGTLSRQRAVLLGSIGYGGIVAVWMAALQPGPPPELAEAFARAGALSEIAGALYRHLFTPLAFAAYGAAAGAAGWQVSFGAPLRRHA